jgi:hypothetical protein
MIGQQVKIHQKTVTHTPLQKLQDAFINIMAGGEGIVEVNQRVKTDASLSCAFGRQSCADQSGVSTTLNACKAENVVQMRQAMAAIYQRYGAGYRHNYGHHCQLLDIDMSGMPAGRQGEGSVKGYFAKQKNKRGRQLGRVYATLYDEIVVERLYSGCTQLNRSLQEKESGKRLSWSSILMMINLAGSMNKASALFPRRLTRFGWLSMPMTCVAVVWKSLSKAPSKGLVSPNATKSRSMPRKCCCCWGSWPTTSLPGCATDWLPVRPGFINSVCCAWFEMPFILQACLFSIRRVISSKFHSIRHMN